MRALVVYESMFGNTEIIARAVADGISARLPVELVEVGSAPAEIGDGVVLLVVGGPTHMLGMSRPKTRQDAVKQADGQVVSKERGIREWLGEITGEAAVATFDTRIKTSWPSGSAAKKALKVLRRKGFPLLGSPASFYVQATRGPLVEGEEARARQWGASLSGAVSDQAV
jgi:flavodoxin